MKMLLSVIKLVARELKKTRAQKGMQSIFARSHG